MYELVGLTKSQVTAGYLSLVQLVLDVLCSHRIVTQGQSFFTFFAGAAWDLACYIALLLMVNCCFAVSSLLLICCVCKWLAQRPRFVEGQALVAS